MSHSNAEIATWQLSLEAAFRPWRRLNDLESVETRHDDAVANRGQGFSALIRCYQDFTLHTLEEVKRHPGPLDAWNIALNVAAIRRFRAGWLAYCAGYYFDAASALRSVFEITMYLATVLQGHFSFDELSKPDGDFDLASMDRRQVKKVQEAKHRKLNAKVKELIYGRNSGLSDSARADMEHHFMLLHMHVHRGESHVVHDVLDILELKQMPKVVPDLDLRKASSYCNAAGLAGWTHTRVLPFLSRPDLFTDEWRRKHDLLDRSFRFFFEGGGMPMNAAFLELMAKSFSFAQLRP